MSTQNITSLDESSYEEAMHSSVSQNSFSYLKIITVEDNQKRMNVPNFINIYTNIYTYIICDKNDSK